MFNEGNFQGRNMPHKQDLGLFEDRVLRAACCDYAVMDRLAGRVCVRVPGRNGKCHDDFSHPARNIVFTAARDVLSDVDADARTKNAPRAYSEKVALRIHDLTLDSALMQDAAKLVADVFGTTDEDLAVCHTFITDSAIDAWLDERRVALLMAYLTRAKGFGKSIGMAEMQQVAQSYKAQLDDQDEAVGEKTTATNTDSFLRNIMEVMPKLLRDMVLESDRLGGTSAEYQMCASVAALQSVMSASVRTVVDLHGGDAGAVPTLDNWLVCGGSGNGKTTAYDRAARAVKQYHRDALDRKRSNKFEVEAITEQLKEAKKEYNQNYKFDSRSDCDGATLPRDNGGNCSKLHKMDQRIRELDTKCDITIKDVTPERIGELLEETSRVNKAGWGWAFMFTDDGKQLVPAILNDLYKKGNSSGTSDLLVNHYNGGAYTKDRCGDNESHCSNGYVHFFASCTPSTFDKLAKNSVSKDDGLLGRTNLVRCAQTERKTLADRNTAYREGGQTSPAIEAWNDRMKELIEWRMSRENVVVLRLCDDDMKFVETTAGNFEKDHGPADNYFYRAGQHIAALIGAFHALECAGKDDSTQPSSRTVLAAAFLFEWLAAHRRAIMAEQARDADEDLQQYVATQFDKVLKGKGQGADTCTLKEVYVGSKFNGKRLRPDETERALKALGHTISKAGKSTMVKRRVS